MTNPYASPRSAVDAAEPETYKPRLFALSGRLGRLRYLAYSTVVSFVVVLLVSLLLGVMTGLARAFPMPDADAGLLIAIGFYLPFFLSYFVMVRRRLNDLDQSGWLALLMLVPVVNVLFGLYLLLWPGSAGANRYGPPPARNSLPLIIFGVVLPIFLIGLLAATAIPAYQDYVNRTQQLQHSSGQNNMPRNENAERLP